MKKDNGSEKIVRKNPKIITAVTAIVVVLIVALNLAFSILGDDQLWYIDISRVKYKSTKSAMYTLSDACRNMVEKDVISMVDKVNSEREALGQEPISLKVVFCADKDEIEGDELARLVSFTARALEKEFPDHIDVQYINITKNPSAVQKYKTTSAATINNSDVIVEFGSEYLVLGIKTFYLISASESDPWAYDGEKRLTSMMLALTRAESPICAITTNHGETLFDENGNVKSEYSCFIELIEGAGYEPLFLDLEKDDIPENCRMMICFDPREDFRAFGNLGESKVSEIEKLDKYLDGTNAFFYICGADAAELPSLEEYLEEWGVTVGRTLDSKGDKVNLTLEDKVNCADAGHGKVVLGDYAKEGVGASFTEDMRERAYPPTVVFGNPAVIAPAKNYIKWHVAASEDGTREEFNYYSYYKNGNSREMLDIFSTHSSASALSDGKVYQIATELERFRLMTVTQETRSVQEGNLSSVTQASYVLALSSTEFLTNDSLGSAAYGNTDVILSVLRNTGSEVLPTDLELKAIYEYEMADDVAYALNRPDVWFYCLTIIPAILILSVGVIVTVRRKYR